MNGLILLDKPEGLTSFKAAAVLRGIYGTKRVGHTGTLDPMATGVLPILIGRATRLCSYILEADKKYTATVRLGMTTDSLDITGRVLTECVASVTDERLVDALKHFTCTYDQVPPMFSAIKKDGVRLYDLARKGYEIEREPRIVSIHSIKLLERKGNDFAIDIHCSKGTYIRSLADDIGKYLGCGAVLTALRRTDSAGFSVDRCFTLEKIKSDPEGCLMPAETAVPTLRKVFVSSEQGKRFMNGAALCIDRIRSVNAPLDGEIFRVFCGEIFLGLSRFDEESRELHTKCVIAE